MLEIEKFSEIRELFLKNKLEDVVTQVESNLSKSSDEEETIQNRIFRIRTENLLYGRNNFEKVLQLSEKLREESDLSKYPALEAEFLLEKAEARYAMGEFEKSLRTIEKAEELIKKVSSTSREHNYLKGKSLFWRAMNKWKRTGLPSAETDLKTAHEFSKKASYEIGRGLSVLGQAIVEMNRGNSEEARTKIEEADSIYSTSKYSVGLGQVKIYRGLLERTSGNHKKAVSAHKDAIKFFETVEHPYFHSLSYEFLGHDYKEMGKLTEAKEAFDNFNKISSKLNVNWTKQEYQETMSEIQSLRGEWKAALKSRKEALKLAEQNEERTFVGTAKLNLAQLLNYSGKMSEALREQEQALEIFKELNNQDGVAWARTSIGRTYHYQGKMNEAVESLTSALKIREEHSSVKNASYTKYLLSCSLFEKGDISESDRYLGEATEFFKHKNPEPQIMFELYEQKVKNLCRSNKIDEISKFVDVMEKISKERPENVLIRNKYNLIRSEFMLRKSQENIPEISSQMKDYLKEPSLTHFQQVRGHSMLSEMLLDYNKIKTDFASKSEILQYINKIEKMNEKEETPLLRAESYSLKGHLAKMEADPKSDSYISEARKISEENGLDSIIERIKSYK